MNIFAIEELFLKQDISEDEARANQERLASLANDSALKSLHRLKKVEAIVSIMACLEERKFEQAYSFFKLFEAISEYEDTIKGAVQIESKPTEERSNVGGIVKY